MRRLLVVLIGAPGCGKGTQAALLIEKYGFAMVSAGSLLRAEVNSGSELGLKIADIMGSGQLVSNDLVNEVIGKNLSSVVAENRLIILDGYPRSVGQAEFLDSACSKIENLDLCVIQFNVDQGLLIDRISRRRICEKCGAPFVHKDGEEEKCLVCGCKSFIQRNDDKPEIVADRIVAYNDISSKVVDFYGEKVYHIAGEQSPEIVFSDIEEVLQRYDLFMK